MKRFLVTGGAGFIGSAVVRMLVRDTPHEVHGRRQAHLCGQSRLRSNRWRTARATASSRPTSPMRTRMRAVVESYQAGCGHASRGREPCGPVHRRPGRVRPDQRGGHLRAPAGKPRLLALAVARRRRRPSASTISRPTRCSALSGKTASSTRNIPTSRLRPIRPRRPRRTISSGPGTTPTACPRSSPIAPTITGPIHFPEKLIPLIILNALEGKPLPVYGRGDNVRDWLFVDDHARALILAAEKGRPGETYAIGGHNERQNIDVVRGICALVDELAPERRHRAARKADLLRHGSSRSRPPLCYRRVENRAGSRLAAGGNLRERPSQDGRMVSGEPGLVGAGSLRRLSRPTSRDRGLKPFGLGLQAIGVFPAFI